MSRNKPIEKLKKYFSSLEEKSIVLSEFKNENSEGLILLYPFECKTIFTKFTVLPKEELLETKVFLELNHSLKIDHGIKCA